jgi:exodeoxyribonuclease VII large subunit
VNTLARGYSITRNESGTIVRKIEEAPAGSMVQVTVSNGMLNCEVKSTKEL